MNKKSLLNTVLLAGAMMFVACDYNEDNFDGFSEGHIPTDVKNLGYTMTAADYKAVKENKHNEELAGEEHQTALDEVALYGMFNNEILAKQYAPAFLATKFFTADEGSAVQLTYTRENLWTDAMKSLNTTPGYEVTSKAYQKVWGEDFNFFTPSKSAEEYLPGILADTLQADSGTIVLVDYRYSEKEPAGAPAALEETFTGLEKSDSAVVEGWLNVTTTGTYNWNARSFNQNEYVQANAFKHEGELETYMITPKLMVRRGMRLSFDACYGHYTDKGGRLSVLILKSNEDLSTYTAEQIAQAKWEDISASLNIPVPEGNYGTLQNVYKKDLSEYAGKNVYIAFRYNGNGDEGATTTVQIDNITVNEFSSVGKRVLYQYDGVSWAPYTGVYFLTDEEYKAMGLSHGNFSSSSRPENYLPQYLAEKYPYAQEGDVESMAYLYYSNNKTRVRGNDYIFVNGAWTASETATDQFVLNSGVWKYDPSMVLVFDAAHKDLAKPYYQAACDWVWKHVDQAELNVTEKGGGYVKSFGDSEFYSGCSAHYGNVSMKLQDVRKQYAQGYEGMSDEDVVELMSERLQITLKAALETVHPTAAPVPGLDVIYTVKFIIYTGKKEKECNHQIKFKVVAPGTFEYVKDSFKKLN